MVTRYRLLSTRGFVALEVMVTVVMLTAVSLGVCSILLHTTRSLSTAKNQEKASTLAGMVFQQYASYAQSNFSSLGQYQVTNAAPKDVFFTADNLGYDGFAITSIVNYSQNQSTCTIQLNIAWTQDGQPRNLIFNQNFSQLSTPSPGALVQLYLKLPCGGYTAASDIIANCPGIPGAAIVAQAVGGSNLPASYTDGSGMALISNVGISQTNQFTLTSATPSDWSVSSTAPGFSQLYYVADQSGGYSTTLSTFVAVNQSSNVIVITGFQPGVVVHGTVYNDSGGTVTNCQVALTGTYGASYGSINMSSSTLTESSDASGNYSFSNLILMNASLAVNGIQGSLADVPPGPGFVQGYFPVISRYGIPTSSFSAVATFPSVAQDIHLLSAGSVAIQTVASDGVTPFPNVSVTVNYHTYGTWWPTVTKPTDANGQLVLYNLLTQVPISTVFKGTTTVSGGWQSQTSVSFPVTALGTQTPVTMTMQPLFLLQGNLQDTNLNAPPARMTQSLVLVYGDALNSPDNSLVLTTHPVTPGNLSAFSVSGFNPYNYTPTPSTSFRVPIQVSSSNWSPAFMAEMIGAAYDSQTGQPATHASVTVSGSTQTFLSGSDGVINTGFMPLAYSSNYDWRLVTCPTGGTLCTFNSTEPIDTGHATLKINGVTVGWHLVDPSTGPVLTTATDGVVPTPMSLGFQLREYLVSGIVTNGTAGGPVAGVVVNDPNSGSATTTMADGSYSLWCTIQNRSGISSPGTVTINVRSGQQSGGATYSGYTQSLPIPASPDPTTPLSAPIILPANWGSSA